MEPEVKTVVKLNKVEVPFCFEGNKNNVPVYKVDQRLGDGEMGSSSHGRSAQVDGSIALKGQTIEAQITLTVWEDNYGKDSKADKLRMTGTINHNFAEAIGGLVPVTTEDSTKIITITKSWRVKTDLSYAQYTGNFPKGEIHNYVYLNNFRNGREWLPIEKILVKFDDKGNELQKQGSIGVKGTIIFYVEVTTVTKTTYKSNNPINGGSGNLIQGTNPVQAVIPDVVRNVLCYGYNIAGNYADIGDVKLPVLNLDKVNNNKFLNVTPEYQRFDGFNIKAESKKEISSCYEQKLDVSVSASGFGATFSNETKKTMKKESSFNEGRKYVSINKVYKNNTYKINITPSTSGLASLLNDTFINDLDRLSPDEIIKNYGTHVILGMVTGARLTYSMSYVKSIEKLSEAKTFSNTTSIGYHKDSAGQKGNLINKDDNGEDQKNEKKEISAVELASKALDSKASAEKIKAVNELIKLVKSNGKSNVDSIPNGSSLGGDIKVGLEINSSQSSTFENESMEDSCTIVGGNTVLENRVCSDLTNINLWEDSLNSSNMNSWADFVNGCLYPIYQFVPAGHKVTPNSLKDAFDRYLAGFDAEKMCGKAVLTKEFTIRGGKYTVDTLNDRDEEIDSKDGKETGWRLFMEPVNLDGGDVAIAIQLIVAENGLNANSSKLILHDVVLIPNNVYSHVAVDSSRLSQQSYTVEGSIFREEHNFIDISGSLRDCPLVDTSFYPFEIRIDGKGNDKENLQIKGMVKIPVIGYED